MWQLSKLCSFLLLRFLLLICHCYIVIPLYYFTDILNPVYNAANVAELAVEKGATTLLIPISARRQLNELSDEMAIKISILFYADAREALIKALGD